MSLHISQFKLKKVAYEVRYRDAFLLFDRTGILLEDARKKWPTIKLESAEPKISAFKIDYRYSLQIKIDSAAIIAYNPKPSLEEFIEDAKSFETLVRKTLEIVEYTRVGFKPTYHKEYKNKESATEDIVSSLGLKNISGKHFNIEGILSNITYEHRWEDDLFGLASQLWSEERTWDFNPPLEAEGLKPEKTTQTSIKYSPDYYTRKSISVNKLDTRIWIENAFHMIKRDSKVFLEK